MPSLLSNTTKGPHYAYRLSKFEHLQSACEAFLFIWLHQVSCGAWDRHGILQIFSCSALTP